jgi:uncharacterized protein (TIGR02452 family)
MVTRWYQSKLKLEASIRGTHVYRPGDLRRLVMNRNPETQKQTMLFEVVNEKTLAGTRALLRAEPSTRVCVLNFASANERGEGFLRRAQAQEKDLARSSGLYECLTKDWDEGEHKHTYLLLGEPQNQ